MDEVKGKDLPPRLSIYYFHKTPVVQDGSRVLCT